MTRILLALLILKATPLMGAFEFQEPLGDYQLVSVLRIGEFTEAVVLQVATKERYRLTKGAMIDGYEVKDIVPESHASHVQLERLGKHYRIAMPRSGELDLPPRVLSLAEIKGHVDASGKLTEHGHASIEGNLRLFSIAAYEHMIRTGEQSVDFQTLAKLYAQTPEVVIDPFAPLTDEAKIRSLILKLEPVMGESYNMLRVARNTPAISVLTSSGERVEFQFAATFDWPSGNPMTDPFALFRN